MKTKLTMIILIACSFCTEAQEWNWSEGKLSNAREGLSATAMDDSIFFSQGRLYNLSFTNVIDIYDVGEDEWASYESQSALRWITVSVSCNGMVFIAGGNNWPGNQNFNDVDIYDKATGEWTVKYLSEARSLIGATCHMNKVFFAGGMFWGYNVAFYDVIDVYNTETETWDTPLYLTEPKAAIGVTAAGGKVFFAGGAPALGVGTDLVEIYDINTGDWFYETLSQARSFPAAVAYGNKVYFAGGALANSLSSNVVDIYNIDTETWEVQTLSVPRIVRALKVKDALVFAGETDFISGGGVFGPANGIIDIYYPETGEWNYEATNLDPARIWYGCAAYGDKAYFGGGWPGGSFDSDIVSILEYPHCFPNGITFSIQAQIDNFQSNYPNCTEIEGDVEISGNNILSLDGLLVLTSIGGFLNIHDNPNLTSLSGLDSISAGSIDSLFIVNNSSLSDCAVKSVCDYLASPNAVVEIHGNLTNCEDQAQVQRICNGVSVEELKIENEISILPNPFTNSTTLEIYLPEPGRLEVKIYSQIGRLLKTIAKDYQNAGLQKVDLETGDLEPGVYFCVLKTDEGIKTVKMMKL